VWGYDGQAFFVRFRFFFEFRFSEVSGFPLLPRVRHPGSLDDAAFWEGPALVPLTSLTTTSRQITAGPAVEGGARKPFPPFPALAAEPSSVDSGRRTERSYDSHGGPTSISFTYEPFTAGLRNTVWLSLPCIPFKS